mmetsp:Transcript_15926/g.24794  ORF Transcript_15926/g.24794 Transcript_15926/m.24794 type:complete len:293 (-) Transcript_15926:162-1040(-)|eukprot:CAMPEP_0195308362 /NCGR_PEP_ID=MMETSP0707-20130614/38187_1 /TAXON_ID=33640 /ORGANISM="Asterionellopsis glacialis, Strain CCMP134" /LENGTH=292 /DNA_ID=CAMNT_0040372629 /DNA_START=1670 /DNA_END=2548 /DNA_ORIENTATION=+
MSHLQSTDAAVGMMDAAYFTGRRELLEFFNSLLDMNLTKIEQTATGAVACQLTDYIFPGSIPMSRVNWGAKSTYEYVANYKLLQSAFSKHKIGRHVEVDKLIRAKYQDNLEFCQWLKAFYDQSGAFREDYDAMAVRCKGKGGNTYTYNGSGGGSRAPIKPAGRSTAPTAASRPKPATSRATATSGKTSAAATTAKKASTESVLADAALMKKNSDLSAKLKEADLAKEELEIERDWYLNKLRSIEIMLQAHQDKVELDEESNPDVLVDKIFKVLYSGIEDNIEVGDDGEFLGE